MGNNRLRVRWVSELAISLYLLDIQGNTMDHKPGCSKYVHQRRIYLYGNVLGILGDDKVGQAFQRNE